MFLQCENPIREFCASNFDLFWLNASDMPNKRDSLPDGKKRLSSSSWEESRKDSMIVRRARYERNEKNAIDIVM
jgi:hypothetical protein